MFRDTAMGCLRLEIVVQGEEKQEILLSPYETEAEREAKKRQAEEGGGTGEDGGKPETFRYEW